MSNKEADRIAVLDKLLDGVIKQKQAARQLGLSTRQTRRLKKKYQKEYRKRKRKEDPTYLLRSVVSENVRRYLLLVGSSKNGNSTWEKLPYSPKELREHLSSQFSDWMSWDNYGKSGKGKRTWNIDHIQPCAALPYDSLDHPNFLKCWDLSNLRPLDAIENISKGANGYAFAF